MTKKKIGVLNFQYSTHNYGAVLQAAALEHILKSEGHDVEHINYIPPPQKNNFKRMVKKVLVFFGLLKSKLKTTPGNSEAFERFRKQFLTRSSKITTPEQFSTLATEYDTIIVGSDQVWRPRMATDPAAFFLAYVPDNVGRVSYAASFGAAEWEPESNDPVTKLAKQELAKFKAISCRETSGVEICKSVFGIDAVHVLDPLLQVADEFIQSIISSSKPSEQKLVYYKLDHDEEFLSVLKGLEEEIGMQAHNIYRKNGELNEYEEVANWLRNIHDANVVVSDSFHCICLALRFGKKIIYYPNPKRGQARMDDLFEYLGIARENCESNKEYFNITDSGAISPNLENLRKRSRLFIQSL